MTVKTDTIRPALFWGGQGVNICAGDSWLTINLPDAEPFQVRGRGALQEFAAEFVPLAAREQSGSMLYSVFNDGRGALYLEFDRRYSNQFQIRRQNSSVLQPLELAVFRDLASWLQFVTSTGYPVRRLDNAALAGPVDYTAGILSCPLSPDCEGEPGFTITTARPKELIVMCLKAAGNVRCGIEAERIQTVETGINDRRIVLSNEHNHRKPLYYGDAQRSLRRLMLFTDLVEVALAIDAALKKGEVTCLNENQATPPRQPLPGGLATNRP